MELDKNVDQRRLLSNGDYFLFNSVSFSEYVQRGMLNKTVNSHLAFL